MSEPGEIELHISTPFTSISFNSYVDRGTVCQVYCCNGWEEIPTYSSSYWTSFTSWWTSFSSSSWDAKEVESEEEEDEIVERDAIQEENQPSGIRSKHPALGTVVVPTLNLYEEQCVSTVRFSNMFQNLHTSRFNGLCSYNEKNGNLWHYGDGWSTQGDFCIQTDGTPIYLDLGDIVFYYDSYTTDVTEDMFVIPDTCDCVNDWDY